MSGNWRSSLRLLWVALALAILAAIPLQGAMAQAAGATPGNTQQNDDSSSADYKLGPSDKVHVDVFGQQDLSGDFAVDGRGFVQFPLIGQVRAAGLSVRDFEDEIAKALRAGDYLKDPHISAEVINFRPFSIIGQVAKPGQYPTADNMSVLDAVALAGGFTFRADESEVYIQHNGQAAEAEYPATTATKVQPGDVIRVGQRFF
jgi:protein involved in polysaccharide export with SLBB domain